MKTINVKVKISGGKAPWPIKVEITNFDTGNVIDYESDISFNENFIVESGSHAILIRGMNPINGHAEMIVSGDFIEGSISSSKRTTKKPGIAELFLGKI